MDHQRRSVRIRGVVQGVGIIAGTVAAGLLGESIGIIAVISFQGVGGMLAGAVVLFILRHDLPREAARGAPAKPTRVGS